MLIHSQKHFDIHEMGICIYYTKNIGRQTMEEAILLYSIFQRELTICTLASSNRTPTRTKYFARQKGDDERISDVAQNESKQMRTSLGVHSIQERFPTLDTRPHQGYGPMERMRPFFYEQKRYYNTHNNNRR